MMSQKSSIQSFATWLQSAIAFKGYSAGEFAVMSGCPSTAVARWLSGLSDPSVEYQVKIADTLGVSFEDIREILGLKHTKFGEYLIRRICQYSDNCQIVSFCLEADLDRSRVNNWVQCKALPAFWMHDETVDKIAAWLASKGDKRPINKIKAEVSRMMVADKGQPKSRKKMTALCQSAKIA